MIKDVYITQGQIYNFEMPSSIDDELSIPKDKAVEDLSKRIDKTFQNRFCGCP